MSSTSRNIAFLLIFPSYGRDAERGNNIPQLARESVRTFIAQEGITVESESAAQSSGRRLKIPVQ